MTIMTRRELIRETKRRYLKADKKGKTKILDEFCANMKFHRKHAIRIFRTDYDYNRIEKRGRKKREKIYSNEFILLCIKIWEVLDYPCGDRLQPSLVEMTKVLERHDELKSFDLNKEVWQKLNKISAKTLNRRLKREREIRHLKRNRGTTKHGSLLKSSVPIRITDWDRDELGFMEMDTVAHNGGDPSGEHIYSLDLVEISAGWSEQIAVLGRGERGIVRAIDNIKKEVPFEIKGFDSDTGSEFVNWHFVRYCEKHGHSFTRSRPAMKNDNAYVEEKNDTHIRRWLGYRRYDTKKQLKLINNLYRKELRLFNNFFRPVMKIKEKIKVNNSICRKKYDRAKTPYQRLLDSGKISKEKQKELNKIYLSLNPVQLKKKIDEKIKQILNS